MKLHFAFILIGGSQVVHGKQNFFNATTSECQQLEEKAMEIADLSFTSDCKITALEDTITSSSLPIQPYHQSCHYLCCGHTMNMDSYEIASAGNELKIQGDCEPLTKSIQQYYDLLEQSPQWQIEESIEASYSKCEYTCPGYHCCGGAHQPCCEPYNCAKGLQCGHEGYCTGRKEYDWKEDKCGHKEGAKCCKGCNGCICDPGQFLVCNIDERCESCGQDDQLCCSFPHQECIEGNVCVFEEDWYLKKNLRRCKECGGRNQPCCKGRVCNKNQYLVCDERDGTCRGCGRNDQLCCPFPQQECIGRTVCFPRDPSNPGSARVCRDCGRPAGGRRELFDEPGGPSGNSSGSVRESLDELSGSGGPQPCCNPPYDPCKSGARCGPDGLCIPD